jgi:hypothetical protein
MYELVKFADISQVNFLNNFRILGLSKREVVLGGSSSMALFGIRPNRDIDAIVTKKVWNGLENNNLFKSKLADSKRESSKYFYHTKVPTITLFEIDYPLGYTAEEALKDDNISFEFEGFHFETLEHLIKWKKAMGREKDLVDMELIRRFLQNSRRWLRHI